MSHLNRCVLSSFRSLLLAVQHFPSVDPGKHAVGKLLKVGVHFQAITDLGCQALHTAEHIFIIVGEFDLLEEGDDILLPENTLVLFPEPTGQDTEE